METIVWDHDTSVFYITAASFPAGIMDAHAKLNELVPDGTGRKFFGISRPENGSIVYRAAVEEVYSGEGTERNCEAMVLRKGKYISLFITDYAKDIQSIGRAFKQLLAQPGLDPNGYCVELYLNNEDVQCMIRLADN